MRYFAMIGGERRGPFELNQLVEAGVHPSTYVWCKGMADWEKAEDVADICRYFRQRIFDRMHPSAPAPAPRREESQQPMQMLSAFPEPDLSRAPAPTLFMAVMATLLCFPITGIVAVYYSYKSRKSWEEAMRSEADKERNLYTDSEREDLRRQAHENDRQAKMWIGITFFLGMIFYAFVGHRFM